MPDSNDPSAGSDPDELVQRFTRIKVWRQGDQRAPHKPLLVLLALARTQRGEPRLVLYEEIETKLRELLQDFGPHRKSYHPELPFWHLRTDGLWEVPEADQLKQDIQSLKRKKNPPPRFLADSAAHGGFTPDIDRQLRSDPDLVNRIATAVLDSSFPASLHADLLDAVGMPWVVTRTRKRDPGFREAILRIYDRRCAICGYDGRLGRNDLALEAAHVKWHAAGGPDTPDNGLALCVFHHKAFDRGAVALDDDRRILVSQDVHGSDGVEQWLLRYQGAELQGPQSGQPAPAAPFVRWHRKEVFREPARV
jgi:putative restriction endonuclease